MKKALVVGINNYPTAPLKGCINDAQAVAALLETHDDHSVNFNVRLEANVMRKGTLRAMIKELFAGKHDTALFYFAGHGLINELGGYLVTPDHGSHDEGISMDELLSLANQSETTNKIIILDCCHSGALSRPKPATGLASQILEGVTILTASRHDETAAEVGGKGVFTTLLLEALKGGAADVNGYVTPAGLYSYVDHALGPWEQRPVFKTHVCGFTTLRRTTPRLALSNLKKITALFPDPTAPHPLDPSYEYTNDPAVEPVRMPPFADPEHVATFKVLQQMQAAGLVAPVGAEYMYWAAMNSQACRLTPLGAHYWRLVKEKKI